MVGAISVSVVLITIVGGMVIPMVHIDLCTCWQMRITRLLGESGKFCHSTLHRCRAQQYSEHNGE